MYFPNQFKFDDISKAAYEILGLPTDTDITGYVTAATSIAELWTGMSWRGGKVRQDYSANNERARLIFGRPSGFKAISNGAPITYSLSSQNLCWDQFSCGCDTIEVEYSVKAVDMGPDVIMGIARIAAWLFEHRGDTEGCDPVKESGAITFLSSYQVTAFVV